MSKKLTWFGVFLLMSVLLISTSSVSAQSHGKPLTLVYSNNINGEIEPCPT